MKVAYLKKAAPEGSVEITHDIFYVMDTGAGFFRRVYWSDSDGIKRGSSLEPLSDQATLGQIKAILESGKTEVAHPYLSLRIFEEDDKSIDEIAKDIQENGKKASSETTRRFIKRVESL